MPRLVYEIEVLGKEIQFFHVFKMQKKKKYFHEERKHREKLLSSLIFLHLLLLNTWKEN